MVVDFLKRYIEDFFYILNDMSPYLLLGFIIAGALYVYLPQGGISKHLGKPNTWAVIKASLLGIPLPLCSCGVIPTGISFFKNGASKGATTSFLISTPQTGLDSILITYSLLGLPFALIRPIVALVTGVVGGFTVNKFSDNKIPSTSNTISSEPSVIKKESKLKQLLSYAFVTFLQDIYKWLIIGILIAAAISTLVPDNYFQGYIGGSIIGMLILLVISTPLYICATSSVPIAAVLILKGISPGAAMVFLMAGPATNIATMIIIGKTMGSKTLLFYLLSIIGGAILFGLFLDHFLPAEWFYLGELRAGTPHSHLEILPFWVKITSSIILLMAIANAHYQLIRTKKNTMKNSFIKDEFDIKKTIVIQGITCHHCIRTITEGVKEITAVKEISIDMATKKATIWGHKTLDIQKVKKRIITLGYDVEKED